MATKTAASSPIFGLPLPAQISSKAAVAALKSLQTKLHETELDRDRDAIRYQNDVNRAKQDMENMRSEMNEKLHQQVDKTAKVLHDLESARAEVDRLGETVERQHEQIRQLQENVIRSDHDNNHSVHGVKSGRNRRTDDLEELDRGKVAHRTNSPSPVHFTVNGSVSTPDITQIVEQACASAISTHMAPCNHNHRKPDPISSRDDDHDIYQLLRSSQSDTEYKELAVRLDKMENLLTLYAKSMLKRRLKERRLKPRPGFTRAVIPCNNTYSARMMKLERIMKRLTTQSGALIDQLNSKTSVDTHRRVNEIIQELDITQNQLRMLDSKR